MNIFASNFFKHNDNEHTQLSALLDRFNENLPTKPYCAQSFAFGDGLKIRSKEIAISTNYIQYNHPNWKKYIVLDIDNESAVVDWIYEKSHLPAPNLVIENKNNGRAHFLYELVDAVSFTSKSSIKAQNYYTAVEKGLVDAFGADKRFTGLICKNPFSQLWRVSSFRQEPYHLRELADKLDLDPPGITQRKKEMESSANDEDLICGRNDEAFHSVRKLAYVDIREFKKNAGKLFDHWFSHVLSLVQNKNSHFINPMDYKECVHIAKSISKFCWKKHNECEQRFITRQKTKGSLGGKKRSAKYEPIRIEAKKLYRKGIEIKDIALKFQVSVRSIQRYVAGVKRMKLLTISDINKYRAKVSNKRDSALNQVLAAFCGAALVKGGLVGYFSSPFLFRDYLLLNLKKLRHFILDLKTARRI